MTAMTGTEAASAARGARRIALWGLLGAALLAVAVAALLQGAWRESGGEPPPVLGVAPSFLLTERSGDVFTTAELAGSPWVADFIFTRCGGVCPRMTSVMRGLRAEVRERFGAAAARFVSVSVDPEHDTPAVLADYAAAYGIEGDDWLFLTGGPAEIQRLVQQGFKLGHDPDAAPGSAEPILHATRFVLVDGEGRIRGYYDPFESRDVGRLLEDLGTLGERPE